MIDRGIRKGVGYLTALRVGQLENGTAFEVDPNGFIHPIISTDANAPNNSIYFSSTQSKLVYKDGVGTIQDLY